ncbi:uncharacterized protein LOC142999430 isoform X2 [Genypterus blacodes]|uniref:uncharacterized protein LOC142999430 isoform X2 n=1 Tax=Genypterus blacodes TaxID=154954 RepID=UPI003F768BC4
MIGGLIALILLRTLCLSQTTEVPQLNALTVVEVGDNVTLHCKISSQHFGLFYWQKQSLGYMSQTVATGTFGKVTLSEQLNNSRFTFKVDGAQYFLTITNVSKEDEATYSCQGPSYVMIFYNSTFLVVNDTNQQKSVDVKQEAETKSVQLGDQVTLRCSLDFKNQENRAKCSGGHTVSWFRSGNSYPGLVYTHWNSSAACVESPSSQRSCDYTLSKHIRSSSDAGTYYCAVATCGEILFGHGTKVETISGPELDLVNLVLGVLLVCCVIVISVLIVSRKRRPCCEHCKRPASAFYSRGHEMPTGDPSRHMDSEAEAMSYAALNFSSRKPQRRMKTSESPQACVYSATREDWE